MIFEFVDAQRASYSVEMLRDVLDVSRAGFYAWKKRGPSQRRIDDARLAVEITAIHNESDKAYGSPRVHAQLEKRGRRVSRKRVARVMRQRNLAGKRRRRFRITTMRDETLPVAPNVLARRFTQSARVGRRHHVPLDARRLDVPRGADRSLLATRCRLGDELASHDRLAARGVANGHPHTSSAAGADPSHRSRLPIREPRLSSRARSARHDLQHEPTRKLLGQRCRRELLRDP